MKRSHHLDIAMSPGWEDVTVHSFLGPDLRGRRDLITVSIDSEAKGSLTDYAEAQLPLRMAAIEEPELMQEEDLSLENGRTVHLATIRAAGQAGAVFHFLAFMKESGAAYIFAARASKPTMKATRGALKQMLESFTPA